MKLTPLQQFIDLVNAGESADNVQRIMNITRKQLNQYKFKAKGKLTVELVVSKKRFDRVNHTDRVIGNWTIGSYAGYGIGYECLCNDCCEVQIQSADVIAKERLVKCKNCNPTAVNNTSLRQMVIDMLKGGETNIAIAEATNTSTTTICTIKAQAGLDGLIEPSEPNADMNFTEISEALGLSRHQVEVAYKSGIAKVMDMIKEIGDIDIDYVDEHFTNTGDVLTGRHYSYIG